MHNKMNLLQKGRNNMIGIHFSGTGNTSYRMEQFVSYYDNTVVFLSLRTTANKRILSKPLDKLPFGRYNILYDICEYAKECV